MIIVGGCIPLLIGLMGLIGWLTQTSWLIRLRPDSIVLQFNTALGFILTGIGLLFLNGLSLKAKKIIGMLIFFWGFIVFVEYVFAIDFGIDTDLPLLMGVDKEFLKEFAGINTFYPGRMAPSSALCFLLIGISFFISGLKHRPKFFSILNCLIGSVIFTLGMIAFLEYMLEIKLSYGLTYISPMSVNASLSFIFIGIATVVYAIVERPDPRSPSFSFWLVLCVSLFCITFTWGMSQAILINWHLQVLQSVKHESAELTKMLKTTFEQENIALLRFAKWLEKFPPKNEEEWAKNLELYTEDQSAFSAIAYVDSDLAIKWIFPADKLAEWANLNLSPILETIPSLERQFTQNIHVKQISTPTSKEKEVLAYIPLRVENEQGFLIAILNLEKFIRETFGDSIDPDFIYSVEIDHQPIYSSQPIVFKNYAERSVEETIDIGEITLQTTTFYNNEITNSPIYFLLKIFAIEGFLLSIILVIVIYQAQQAKMRLIEINEVNKDLKNQITVRQQTEISLLESQKELKRAKDAAEEANQSKGLFLASMSHELRTPLNSILGTVDLLDKTPLSKDQKEYIDLLNSSGTHLLSIIDDIFDFSKIEAGLLKLHLIDFNLLDMLEKICEELTIIARKKNLEIHCNIDKEVPIHLNGDPLRLRQILTNLISNAIKFTQQGTVTVTVKKASETLLFSVNDTGIGIPAEKQQFIFQRYFQADTSPTRRSGAGLGLAICKSLVKMMGGKIWFQSIENQGSTFYFSIPFQVARQQRGPIKLTTDLAAATTEVDAVPYKIPLKPSTILIAEDSSDNLLLLQFYLKNQPYLFDHAENGKIAVEKFKESHYDLVLMDLQMPVMDGWTAVKLMREWENDQKKSPAPIIALTAYVLPAEIQAALDAGCTHYLTKPINKQTLLETLSQFIHSELTDIPGITMPQENDVLIIQSDLQPIIPQYLENIKRNLKEILDAINVGELNNAAILGHRMKGSGGGYGIQKITELGALIEQEAKNQNPKNVQKYAEELLAYLNRVEVKYH